MSENKSVTETKPDQNNVLPEKQGVKRRRKREYTLYFHRDWNGRIRSLSTSTLPPEEDPGLDLPRVDMAIVVMVIIMFLAVFALPGLYIISTMLKIWP